MCSTVTVRILYHSERFRAFILVKIVHCWPPLLVSLEAKMFPSVWLSVIVASSLSEGIIPPLFDTHSLPHMHAFTLSSLFLCIISSFIAIFFLTLPAQAVCVNGALLCFVVGPLQAQLCLTRVLLLSIDIDRASLCVSESVPLTVLLFFFYLSSPSLWIHQSPPSSHSLLLFIWLSFAFSVFWCLRVQSSPGEFQCPQWTDYM